MSNIETSTEIVPAEQQPQILAKQAPRPPKKPKPARKQVKPGDVVKTETVQTGKEYSTCLCIIQHLNLTNHCPQTFGITNGLVETARIIIQSTPARIHLLCQILNILSSVKQNLRLAAKSNLTQASPVPTQQAINIYVFFSPVDAARTAGSASTFIVFLVRLLRSQTHQKTVSPVKSLPTIVMTWVV
jgi:hypothetical protein